MKKHIVQFTLALALAAIAALSTSVAPVVAQRSSLDDCFNGQGSLNSNLKVDTNFQFRGKALLLTLEAYDSGKTATLFGVYRGRSEKPDDNGGYIYNYTPLADNCPLKNAIFEEVRQKYPGYKVTSKF